MAQHKTRGRAQKLIVAGCLVERYRDEIQKNIPEVDAVVGTGELEKHTRGRRRRATRRSEVNSPVQHPELSRPEGDPREEQGASPATAWDGAIAALPKYLYDETTPRMLATPRDGIHQDRRGLRSSLQLLHHPAAARKVPLAPI